MEIETLNQANALISKIDELKAYKNDFERDNAGDYLIDLSRIFPDIYNDLKVYMCMLFDKEIETVNNQFKNL